MKLKILIRTTFTLLVLVLIHSCQSPIIDDEMYDDSMKSLSLAKANYIVVLDDNELDLELEGTLSYEKKNEKVKDWASKILNRANVLDGEIIYTYSTALKGFAVKIPPGQLKKLGTDSSVKHVEKDQVVILRPGKGKPPKDNNTTSNPQQVEPWGISRVGGANSGVGKTAWIIDTGIDLDHPDLNVDTDRAVNFSTDKDVDDLNGHGTHVSGTIAAIDNNIGVVGVAAGATVVPVKVLNRRGSGSYSSVIAGVDYVAANGSSGDVANMSLGGGASDALDQAVINASNMGIRFALAAGNESGDANNHSPARANAPNIYTVSAMDSNDVFAYFSNYGNPPIDFCAPGISINSTYKNGGYATLNGTSMATPHVAGLLLLGAIQTNGYVTDDPDNNPDPIAHN